MGLETEECGGVTDVAEEEKGGDGDDQERNCDDFGEVFGKPCGEIEILGFGETRRKMSCSGKMSMVLGFGKF